MPELDTGADFVTDDDALAEEVNARFDAIETAFNASIARWIASTGSSGQIPVVNGSGNPQLRTPSGVIEVSSTGVFSFSDTAEADALGTRAIVKDAAERTTVASDYQELGTGFEIELEVGTDDIVWLLYRSLWKNVGGNDAGLSASAAIFVDGEPLEPHLQGAWLVGDFPYTFLMTGSSTVGTAFSGGLVTNNTGTSWTPASGPILPTVVWSASQAFHLDSIPIDGLSAGTHTFDVRYHAGGNGTTTVKERVLRGWTQPF